MTSAEAASPLVLTLVAGGFTIFGVTLKIGYDSLAARRATKNAGLERFSDERRQAYERFYELVQRQLAGDKALYGLVLEHREGKTEISDEEKARVPRTALVELITTLDQIRRLARIYSVVTSAEAIVQLFVDMTRATSAALEDPGPNDEITWFLLQRFLEDRVAEFVHGYREDLGLGRPAGAPKKWPIVPRERPFNLSLAQSEEILRAHIPIKIMPKPSGKQSESEAGSKE
jgi:hypothetical protein